MSCFIDNDAGTTTAVLSFKRDQLLYDIKNYAYIEGSVMETDNVHSRHSVQDVGDYGNIDRVIRVLDIAVAKCREMLHPYTKHEVHRRELDDKLRFPSVYGIVVRVPDDFSQTSLNLLEKLIHEYLVCSAVSDWMSITNPVRAETWAVKAAGAEREIMICVGTRMSRVRRRMHPF